MTNQTIRQAARASGVRLWRIAEALGVTDSTLSRKLRRELSPEETAHILGIIDSLRKEGRNS